MLRNLLNHMQATVNDRPVSVGETTAANSSSTSQVAPPTNETGSEALASELDRLATAEREERDRQRELELAALRERAKFD